MGRRFYKTDYIITYGSLVQEAMREYSNIVDIKQWEPTDIEIFKDNQLWQLKLDLTRLWRNFI